MSAEPSEVIQAQTALITQPEFDWRNPDYLPVWKKRAERLARLRSDPDLLHKVKAYYRDGHFADFINDWAVTLDPRVIGRPAMMPMLLWPKQREYIDWLYTRWRNGDDGVCVKSRDVGISWLAMGFASSVCIFYEDMSIGFGSEKEDKVDRTGDPDTLFYKGRMFLQYLPDIFRGGWTLAKHSAHTRLVFPWTGSSITGEAGLQIGRGGRKAQKTTTPVLTPEGWRTMGSLQIGDHVIGRNGQPTRIAAVHPQGVVPLYRVRFDDGSSTECCGDHLWHVRTKHQRKNEARRGSTDGTYMGRKKPLFSVMSTRELLDMGITVKRQDNQVEYRYQIPQCEPVQYVTKELPIHPYLLGVLLGDGGITQNIAMLTCADQEIVDRAKSVLPAGINLVKGSSKYSWRFNSGYCSPGKISPLKVSLMNLGLFGKGSGEKFIPEIYLRGSVDQRIDLLRGLIDTDGWVSARGHGGSKTGFLSTSHHLLEGVTELVQSLGGIASYNWKKGSMMSYPNGYKKWFDGCYELRISTPMNPAYLERKARNWKPRQKYALARSIVGIEPVEPSEAKCITVEADDGLYLTNDHIVTHNSIYFIDESAHLPDPKAIDASLSATTNCRIDMSSVWGMANSFAERAHNPSIPRFDFAKEDDPRRDAEYWDKKREKTDPVIFAQEYDRNFTASIEGQVIPSLWVTAAIDAHILLGITPDGARRGALDVADAGKDANAFAIGRSFLVERVEMWKGSADHDIYHSIERAFLLCDTYGVPEFYYDADGLGAGARGDARKINEARAAAGSKLITVMPYRGSGEVHEPDVIVPGTERTALDFFENAKAQAWWMLRQYFQYTYRTVEAFKRGERPVIDVSQIISIASNFEHRGRLTIELSQAVWALSKRGKVMVDKCPPGTKAEVRNALASPNLADAVVILRAPRYGVLSINPALLAAASGGQRRSFR